MHVYCVMAIDGASYKYTYIHYIIDQTDFIYEGKVLFWAIIKKILALCKFILTCV